MCGTEPRERLRVDRDSRWRGTDAPMIESRAPANQRQEPRHSRSQRGGVHLTTRRSRPYSDVDVQVDPDRSLLRQIAELAPTNALLTPAYAQARSRRGDTPVAILSTDEDIRVGFTAFLVCAGAYHRLDIESAPDVAAGHPLWRAIRRFCATRRVIRIRVDSFGSSSTAIPTLGREVYRNARQEYVLDLDDRDLLSRLSTNHRRNVRRAQNMGLEVFERADPASVVTHEALIDRSKARRRDRGESIYRGMSDRELLDLLDVGAGTLFQAGRPGEAPLSSLLVLRSERGAYYHSAGTSPDGMVHGASQFLVASVAEQLKRQGIRQFNLGGAAEDQAGLARFKSGFGPRVVDLESACFDTATGLLRLWLSVSSRLPSIRRQQRS